MTISADASKIAPDQIRAAFREHAAGLAAKETKIRIPGNRIDSAKFLDTLNGWVSVGTTLLGTKDGGDTWARSGLLTPSDSYITSFFFVNLMEGSATLVNVPRTAPWGYGHSSHVVSTRDGGRT